MDSYTEFMNDELFLEQDDEEYSEKFKRALEMFRSFDEALSVIYESAINNLIELLRNSLSGRFLLFIVST